MQTLDLTCSRGDTAVFAFNTRRTDVNGTDGPVDLTGGTVVFTARRNYASPVVFERTSSMGGGIAINADPTTGRVVVTLQQSDTSGLSNEETALVYSLRVTTPAGVWVVAGGKLSVEPLANTLA